MSFLLGNIPTFFFLFIYGLYHLTSSVRSHLLRHVSAKPYHPLPLSSHRSHVLRHFPLYLTIFLLLIAILHSAFTSAVSDNLHFASLQSSIVLLLFQVIALSFVLFPLPSDVTFLIAALAFLLLSLTSRALSVSFSSSDLQSSSHHVESVISFSSAAAAVVLAINPTLFIAEVAISVSVCLRGLWALQAGLMLYVDGFVPKGCHILMDVKEGGAPTRCDLDESRVRAKAIMDLVLVVDAVVLTVIFIAIYVSMRRFCVRRGGVGSYEPLPTSTGNEIVDHVQMKPIGKNSMQA